MKPGVETVKLSVIRGRIGPMSKHIPDEAVEAAVEVLWDKEVTARDVRLALEAAAPHMLADAWEAGAEAGSDNQCAWDGWRYSKGYPITNPYRTTL